MNVARARRRLIAARRYAYRQYLPGQKPLPDWAAQPGDHDSRSVLRAVAKLAGRKYSNGLATALRRVGRDGTDCGGWALWAPCGCARCQRDLARHRAGLWQRYASEADCRLRRLV